MTLPLFQKGDGVDVFLRKPFGWIEGKVVGVERFHYRIRLESVYQGKEEVHIPFWATVSHDEVAVAPHRTHCREDWRLNIDKHTHLECVENGRWTQCKKLLDKDGRILILTASDCHWFPVESPHLRCLWEFRDLC